jgi:hypothetical protein
MNFAEEIRIIIDSLTYVDAYGPDQFPKEDNTDLSSETRRIIERFDVVARVGRGSTRQHWLSLARHEIVAGFDLFSSDAARAHRHFDDAIGFIRRAIRGAAPKASFVVGPDGVAHHAQSHLP